ncbi:hypothetical protein ILYODFUR_001956 [Ilyodon furcidens]|uniref:Uncharacterized protein n=1 Tax=Ilyodon furcidens TaxID=33524 RepID=A0ABV0STY3_9TELE
MTRLLVIPQKTAQSEVRTFQVMFMNNKNKNVRRCGVNDHLIVALSFRNKSEVDLDTSISDLDINKHFDQNVLLFCAQNDLRKSSAGVSDSLWSRAALLYKNYHTKFLVSVQFQRRKNELTDEYR